jgi:Zn-dependent peptidase ImmA (M78 family)
MKKTLDDSIIPQVAKRVLVDNSIESFPVDPIIVAKKNEISVFPMEQEEQGVSGMLLMSGNNFGISYAVRLNNRGYEHFSIAHELGHFFLEGHTDSMFSSSEIHKSSAGNPTGDIFERQADLFASNLLMPEDWFRNCLWKYEPGYDGISKMAELCQTSLTSTAIRYVTLAETKIGIIVSSNGVIDYCFLSEKMKRIPEMVFPRKGWKVPKETSTASLCDTSTHPSGIVTKTDVRLSDWFECRSSVWASEEIINLGSYGKTLTIVSV